MRLTVCGCSAAYFQREQRKWWMKPISSRRLYRCLACDALLFIPSDLVNRLLQPDEKFPRMDASVPPPPAAGDQKPD
jgi:hypothetical protein